MNTMSAEAHASAMSEHITVKTTCLCKNFSQEFVFKRADLPLKTYVCHCDSCRHMTGTLCWWVAFLPGDSIPSATAIQELRTFQYSKRIQVYFCPTCGSHTFARVLASADDPDSAVSWGISVGTLDQADGVFQVHAHEHISDTTDGGFSDFLVKISGREVPRWPGQLDVGHVLGIPWSAAAPPPQQVSSSPTSDDKLHAHCKCGGVSFYISRPSRRSAEQAGGNWSDLLVPHTVRDPPPVTEAWWLRDRATKFLAGNCACDSCRLASGAELVQWAFIPVVDVSLDIEGRVPMRFDAGTLVQYRSSPTVRRYFCGVCGAKAFFDKDERNMLVDVAVGLLEASEGARAESWLDWATSRVSFREDTVGRAENLIQAVEEGLRSYGDRKLH